MQRQQVGGWQHSSARGMPCGVAAHAAHLRQQLRRRPRNVHQEVLDCRQQGRGQWVDTQEQPGGPMSIKAAAPYDDALAS